MPTRNRVNAMPDSGWRKVNQTASSVFPSGLALALRSVAENRKAIEAVERGFIGSKHESYLQGVSVTIVLILVTELLFYLTEKRLQLTVPNKIIY